MVGDTLGVIEEITQKQAGQAAPIQEEEKTVSGAAVKSGVGSPERERQGAVEPEKGEQEREKATSEEPRATPVANRIARELNVDLAQIRGTGPGGRVTREDVEGFVKKEPSGQGAAEPRGEDARGQPAPPKPQPPPPVVEPETDHREERVRMSRRRRTIAQRLVEAQQTAAMLTTFNEVDMSAVMELRKRRNEAFQERYGIKLGITSFFIKAAIAGLKAFPLLNGEVQGDEIILKHYYDIGVAVGAPEGLVVPVLRNADRMSFAQIEQKIKDFARRAEDNSLTLEDLRGGSFSITNGGVFGSLMSTPILNPPQVGILGLHKIEQRPVVLDNGEIVARLMMYVALSYDHRIVDGREAVQFLVRVKELVEDPESLLIEG
jgi:2-oxoglutarate dehydrogenase E2 component (dihydrolipoamide succinyltransferase)